jgi:phosphoribosylamine---glycine ligase
MAQDSTSGSHAHAPSASTTQNILLIGGGGREHSIAWKLKQSPKCGTIYSTDMANPGLAAICKPMDIPFDVKDPYRLQRWCIEHRIALAIVGPEEPLCQGVVDILASEPGSIMSSSAIDEMSGTHGHAAGGLKASVPSVFGPSKAAAMLEGDKAFAKEIMRHAKVPTAEGRAFTDHQAARKYLESRTEPHVVKAAGLAKGKGVFVPSTMQEASAALDRIMLAKEFGSAGDTVLVEEKLKGREVSVFALVDGRTIYVLETAQDHKRLLDGAQGPNTGGMGALCPNPTIDEAMLDRIQREILVPTIDVMKREGIEYRGLIYAGIMLTPGGPKVLEFNCRFGDPECQTLMARLENDLIDVCQATANRGLDQIDLRWKKGVSVCLVMASTGYPDKPRTGIAIEGIQEAAKMEDVTIFHAGTKLDSSGNVITAGGRVLNVVATAATASEARKKVYAAAAKIRSTGLQWRTDIATEIVG